MATTSGEPKLLMTITGDVPTGTKSLKMAMNVTFGSVIRSMKVQGTLFLEGQPLDPTATPQALGLQPGYIRLEFKSSAPSDDAPKVAANAPGPVPLADQPPPPRLAAPRDRDQMSTGSGRRSQDRGPAPAPAVALQPTDEHPGGPPPIIRVPENRPVPRSTSPGIERAPPAARNPPPQQPDRTQQPPPPPQQYQREPTPAGSRMSTPSQPDHNVPVQNGPLQPSSTPAGAQGTAVQQQGAPPAEDRQPTRAPANRLAAEPTPESGRISPARSQQSMGRGAGERPPQRQQQQPVDDHLPVAAAPIRQGHQQQLNDADQTESRVPHRRDPPATQSATQQGSVADEPLRSQQESRPNPRQSQTPQQQSQPLPAQPAAHHPSSTFAPAVPPPQTKPEAHPQADSWNSASQRMEHEEGAVRGRPAQRYGGDDDHSAAKVPSRFHTASKDNAPTSSRLGERENSYQPSGNPIGSTPSKASDVSLSALLGPGRAPSGPPRRHLSDTHVAAPPPLQPWPNASPMHIFRKELISANQPVLQRSQLPAGVEAGGSPPKNLFQANNASYYGPSPSKPVPLREVPGAGFQQPANAATATPAVNPVAATAPVVESHSPSAIQPVATQPSTYGAAGTQRKDFRNESPARPAGRRGGSAQEGHGTGGVSEAEVTALKEELNLLRAELELEKAQREHLSSVIKQMAQYITQQRTVQQTAVAEDSVAKEHAKLMETLREQRAAVRQGSAPRSVSNSNAQPVGNPNFISSFSAPPLTPAPLYATPGFPSPLVAGIQRGWQQGSNSLYYSTSSPPR